MGGTGDDDSDTARLGAADPATIHQCGVTRQTIIAIEGGKYAPSLELGFKIALAFGVPIGEVFAYEVGDE